jgi:hypothetical protein
VEPELSDYVEFYKEQTKDFPPNIIFRPLNQPYVNRFKIKQIPLYSEHKIIDRSFRLENFDKDILKIDTKK